MTGDVEKRLDDLEAHQAFVREQDVTLKVVYDKTVRDPGTGETRSVPGDVLPDSEYDFSDWGDRMPDGRRYRTAYPRENGRDTDSASVGRQGVARD